MELIEVIMNNSLGVASFIALIYFINTSLKDITESMKKINNTMEEMNKSLILLTDRVEDLERSNNRR